MIDKVIKSDQFVSFFSDKNFFILLLIGTGIFFIFLTIYIIIESRNYKKEKLQSKPKDFSAPSKTELDIILQKMEEAEKEEQTEMFEDEQEAKAIISYQELLEKKQPIEQPVVDELVLEDEGELEMEEQKKFRNSDFISPVFGRVNKSENEKQITVGKEVPQEIISDEIDLDVKLAEGEEFLKSLKEFRKNLE